VSIIVLNGASSAGKTTLARALRDRLGPRSAMVSIDELFRWVAADHPNEWKLFATLTDATFAAASALADGGLDVVVDTVFERPECVTTARRHLGARPVCFVAVTCPLEVLEARERARGDRTPGQARGQLGRVLQDLDYDLTVDTSELSLKECTDRVARLIGR
jgi:chloramphenicol 3-O phosphotransferase